MKRFVTYIYEYERGSRGRNVGFIRTDIRDSCCRMEIHIRGLDRFKGRCTVYLAVTDDPVGIPAAEILISQGSGFLKLTCQQNRIGNTGYLFSDLQAVVIRYGSGKVLAGCFVNEPSEKILRGDFTILGSNTESEPEIASPVSAEASTAEPGTSTREIPAEPEQPDNRTTPSVPDTADSRTAPSAPDTAGSRTIPSAPDTAGSRTVPSVPDMTGNRTTPSTPSQTEHRTIPSVPGATGSRTVPSAPDTTGSRTTRFTTDTAAPVIPDMTGSKTAAPSTVPPSRNKEKKSLESMSAPAGTASLRRIGITDIRSLPKCNWKLCNNSFLVHGFFNYHYLILKTVENGNKKQQFIGVPGIYEQPERMMALLFGFPEFEADENSPDMPSANATGTFGYWMCPLSAE